jgi:hypothetical protein
MRPLRMSAINTEEMINSMRLMPFAIITILEDHPNLPEIQMRSGKEMEWRHRNEIQISYLSLIKILMT